MITQVSPSTFVAGRHNDFLLGAPIALAGVAVAFVVRRGNGAVEAHPAI